MEIQMKRGLLEACVLKSLVHGESYGYKIIKDISPYVEISESTLYPILKRLESSNDLTVRSSEHNGRLRKYYGITDAGINHIKVFIEDWQEVQKAFNYIISEDE